MEGGQHAQEREAVRYLQPTEPHAERGRRREQAPSRAPPPQDARPAPARQGKMQQTAGQHCGAGQTRGEPRHADWAVKGGHPWLLVVSRRCGGEILGL